MAKQKVDKIMDATTEEKIKSAAKAVFYKKGFAATRTRDIAEEAGINLALLNYYFRSKQKLFELIILEALSNFFKSIQIVFNDENTSLEHKVESIVLNYINLILSEPEIPTFIITEIRNNPQLILSKLPFKSLIKDTVFVNQYLEAVQKGRINQPNPLHFLINIMGLTIFPFMAKPILVGGGAISEPAFNTMMEERKKLIPIWIKAIMKAK